MKGLKKEMTKRQKLPMKSELNDENLIQAINSKVFPVAEVSTECMQNDKR